MTEVFVDTSYWLAMLNPRDAFHSWAVHVARPPRMVSTLAVELEVMDAFSAPSFRPLALEFWRQTNNDPGLAVVPLANDLLAAAVTWFESHRDKSWSMTDCISFVVMRQRGITDALSSDHHFEQAGFRILFK